MNGIIIKIVKVKNGIGYTGYGHIIVFSKGIITKKIRSNQPDIKSTGISIIVSWILHHTAVTITERPHPILRYKFGLIGKPNGIA